MRSLFFHFTINTEAYNSALAFECVREQTINGGTPDYINFAKILIELDYEPESYSKDNLYQIALNNAVDIVEFRSCFESNKYKSKIDQDNLDVEKLGISGRPGFIINGENFPGAQPYENFVEIIEKHLK